MNKIISLGGLRGMILLGAFLLLLSGALLSTQRPSSEHSPQPLFAIEQTRNHLGSGATISADGKLLAYIGTDNGLYIRNLDTGEGRLLLKQTDSGLDVFDSPSFSPDASQVLFSAGGGTWYYPSSIFSINVDGSGLTLLFRAPGFSAQQKTWEGGPYFAYDLDEPKFSTDGSKIAVQVYDTQSDLDKVGIGDAGGSQIETLAVGTPLFWSAASGTIYYSEAGVLKRLDPPSRSSQLIVAPKGRILGGLTDRDGFALDDGQYIHLIFIQDASVTASLSWNVARTRFAVRKGDRTPSNTLDQLTLTAVEWSRSGRVLLVYQGDAIERFEVILAPTVK